MDKIDLIEILHDDISRIGKVNEDEIALYDMEVEVYPRDIRKMLRAYLDNKITSDDLINWAGFICVRGEYCSPNYLDEQMADYYEDMFYVLQRLSTPQIDGEINEERVKRYLSELDKYPPDPA